MVDGAPASASEIVTTAAALSRSGVPAETVGRWLEAAMVFGVHDSTGHLLVPAVAVPRGKHPAGTRRLRPVPRD